MLKTISLDNEFETRRWDEFVEAHPKGSPYHLSSWIRTIQKTYGYRPLLYVCKGGSGRISGVFPCFRVKGLFKMPRIVSIPFSDYCGPLFKHQDELAKMCYSTIEKHRNSVDYFEIRSPLPHLDGLVDHNYYKINVLDLSPDPPEVKKRLNKKTIQYSIRKAIRAGVTIKEENSKRGMREFCRLNELTRKKHGVPSQPKLFFSNIFEQIIAKKRGFILLAMYDAMPVAAGLFLKFKNTVYYKYSASDPQYLSQKTPNHLLTWHAIEQACLTGYRSFDFGRTSQDNTGLIRYKEMWGAESRDLPYCYYPEIKGATARKESDLVYRVMTSLWRRLPDAIIAKLGPMIYKYLG